MYLIIVPARSDKFSPMHNRALHTPVSGAKPDPCPLPRVDCPVPLYPTSLTGCQRLDLQKVLGPRRACRFISTRFEFPGLRGAFPCVWVMQPARDVLLQRLPAIYRTCCLRSS